MSEHTTDHIAFRVGTWIGLTSHFRRFRRGTEIKCGGLTVRSLQSARPRQRRKTRLLTVRNHHTTHCRSIIALKSRLYAVVAEDPNHHNASGLHAKPQGQKTECCDCDGHEGWTVTPSTDPRYPSDKNKKTSFMTLGKAAPVQLPAVTNMWDGKSAMEKPVRLREN